MGKKPSICAKTGYPAFVFGPIKEKSFAVDTGTAPVSNTPASAPQEIPGTPSSVMNERRKASDYS